MECLGYTTDEINRSCSERLVWHRDHAHVSSTAPPLLRSWGARGAVWHGKEAERWVVVTHLERQVVGWWTKVSGILPKRPLICRLSTTNTPKLWPCEPGLLALKTELNKACQLARKRFKLALNLRGRSWKLPPTRSPPVACHSHSYFFRWSFCRRVLGRDYSNPVTNSALWYEVGSLCFRKHTTRLQNVTNVCAKYGMMEIQHTHIHSHCQDHSTGGPMGFECFMMLLVKPICLPSALPFSKYIYI